MKLAKIILGISLAMLHICTFAQSYRPESDDEVLEVLPLKYGDKLETKKLQAELRLAPEDYVLALELANNFLRLGRQLADPRYYSYAEAALSSWLKPESPKPEALVLRATILQNRHEFEAALSDLAQALARNPRLTQAWLTQAAIYEATGRYPDAIKSCLALTHLSSSLASSICLHSALSLSGQAETSYQNISILVSANSEPETLIWAYTVLAEVAERLNRPYEAENWYQKALSLNYRSVYLLMCYADFLLDHNRPEQAADLLKKEIQSDALLLRLTLAEKKMKREIYQAHAEILRGRMAAAQQRGDKTHEGDEAKFFLHILNDPHAALRLAQSNWEVQKEPRDLRILLETALAAKQPEAARSALIFISQNHLQDHRLQDLINLVKG